MKKLICALTIITCLVFANIPIAFANSSGASITNVTQTISIVSPSTDTVYTKDLLISIKASEAKTLRLKVNKITDKDSTGQPVQDFPLVFETTSTLNFYTTQINNIKPGSYKIIIEELDANQKATLLDECKVTVKEKQNTTGTSIFSPPAQQNNTLQIIQTIIKNIFGGSEK